MDKLHPLWIRRKVISLELRGRKKYDQFLVQTFHEQINSFTNDSIPWRFCKSPLSHWHVYLGCPHSLTDVLAIIHLLRLMYQKRNGCNEFFSVLPSEDKKEKLHLIHLCFVFNCFLIVFKDCIFWIWLDDHGIFFILMIETTFMR